MRDSLVFAVCALAVGCSSSPPPAAPAVAPDLSHRYLVVEHEDGRRATLDPGARRSARVLHVVSLVPAPEGGVTPQAIRFAFTELTCEQELLLPNGKRTPHPDLAVLQAAERELRGTEADVDTIVLARLHDLITLDSRTQLLSRVTRLPMSPPKLEALVETITTPSVLGAPGPEGLVGGNPGAALSKLLPLLATRKDLSSAHAARLLEALPRANAYAARARTLTALMNGEHVGVEQALAATQVIAADARFAVLKRLAATPLTPPQARAVLENALSQRHYARRAAIVGQLAPASRELLSVTQLIAACQRLSDDDGFGVLIRAAQTPTLSAADARALLAVARKLRRYERRAQLLNTLGAPKRKLLTVSQIVQATASLSSDERYRALVGLAKRPTLTPEEAATVLQAALKLRHYGRRNQVLALLAPPKRELLSVEQIVNAAASLSSDDLAKTLIGVAKRRPLGKGDAQLLADQAPKLRDYRARKTLLLSLIGAADDEALTQAAKSLDRKGETELLRALLKQRKSP